MGSEKKFYAVARGRRPGIYTTWFGAGGAQSQVKGVKGARYKGFGSRAEAQSWLEELQKGAETAARSASAHPEHPDGIIIYTDGSALGNPGPGGYGVVIMNGEERREFSGGYRRTTNNRMELLAAIVALENITPGESVTLFTDSRYVANGMDKGWAKRWRSNGWMRTKTEPAINADLWARLLELAETRNVSFCWVRGHAGTPENERCDMLARGGASGRDLPLDEGFERPSAPAGQKSLFQ